ncbi:MAG TPA: penicillin-binding transpeptidase domain-containing protein [Phycisphaerae bacterium]|nr:penicillin-binding transpeptidase domain-containing protein [Phycisphaerae bacterium]
MLKRRLVLVLIFSAAALLIIGARLAELQLAEAQQFRNQALNFSYRHFMIPTVRGSIVDCKGRYLAVEEPCYNLAIQYEAMNEDDEWITQEAVRELKAENGTLTRKQILALLPQKRELIAQELDAMPAAIAQLCGISVESVNAQYDVIRQRMQLLREDVWTIRYSHQGPSDLGATADDLDMELGVAENVDLAPMHEPQTIVPHISDQVALYLRKHGGPFPGLVVVPSTYRVYPMNSVAAQVIGSVGPVSAKIFEANTFELPELIPGTLTDTVGNLKGYLPGDLAGISGVELAAENMLHGVRGVRVVNLDGQELPADRRNPTPGQTVHLTIDAGLQSDLQNDLLNPNNQFLTSADGQVHNAAVTVLSLADSHVLLMLSVPTYDLNTFHDQFGALASDNNFPMLNRAAGGAFPPGSTIKPLVAAIATTDGVISHDTIIDCGPYLFPGHPDSFRDWTYPLGHGAIDMPTAIEQSCDVYFYTVGMRLGLARLTDGLRSFGLGATTGVGLPEESAGFLPNVDVLENNALAVRTDPIFMGIGQGPISATPLQMATAYAALLRGGLWIAPQLIQGLGPQPQRQIQLNTDELAYIRQGMYLVVHGSSGTAHALQMNIAVAGKTGTAQTSERITQDGKTTVLHANDGWFVGYVPADNPQYVIAAVVEMTGGEGGSTAAPIVRQCIIDMEKHNYLPQVDEQ